jgi:hypothetical protein
MSYIGSRTWLTQSSSTNIHFREKDDPYLFELYICVINVILFLYSSYIVLLYKTYYKKIK